MGVIAEVTLRSTTREQYDAIRERTGWLTRPPEGGLAHLTWWEGADCHNLDGWESEQAFASFGAARPGPATAARGPAPPPPWPPWAWTRRRRWSSTRRTRCSPPGPGSSPPPRRPTWPRRAT